MTRRPLLSRLWVVPALLAVTPAPAQQLLAVSPCNVLDERPEARETITDSFDECVAFLRTNQPYWGEGVPKVVAQHLQLLRGNLAAREVGEAERVHRKAIDLFSTLVGSPVHSRTESELAAAMIADYLVLSQRLRQMLPEAHPRYAKVEAEAFAKPLAVLTRVMDRRGMLTATLAQHFRTRMRRRGGAGRRPGVLVPNKLDLPTRADPVEMLLAGLELRVAQYRKEEREARAHALVARCRELLGPPRKPKGRWWIRVERRLRRLARP